MLNQNTLKQHNGISFRYRKYKKKAAEQIKGDTSKILDVNLSAIQNATPGSLKPQGNAKLSGTITAIGKKYIQYLHQLL